MRLPASSSPFSDGRADDDGRAVLVVVEDRDRHAALQPLLDLEALRRLDVLEVDAAEGRLERRHHLDEPVDVLLGHLDVEHVDAGELLEQDGLALHHGLRGERADVAEARAPRCRSRSRRRGSGGWSESRLRRDRRRSPRRRRRRRANRRARGRAGCRAASSPGSRASPAAGWRWIEQRARLEVLRDVVRHPEPLLMSCPWRSLPGTLGRFGAVRQAGPGLAGRSATTSHCFAITSSSLPRLARASHQRGSGKRQP